MYIRCLFGDGKRIYLREADVAIDPKKIAVNPSNRKDVVGEAKDRARMNHVCISWCLMTR
jgi:hypothetical protein